MRTLIARFLGLFRKAEMEQEFDAELRQHVDLQIEENLKKGMSPSEARYAALRSLGGVEQIKENYRDQRGLPPVESFFQDLRYGFRMAWKWRGLTAILALTLALGIGANTAIFSLVNAFLLRPLPVAQPQSIAVLAIQQKDAPVGSSGFSYPEFVDFRDQADAFSSIFGLVLGTVELNADNRSDQCAANYVTANFFTSLGIAPAAGRFILPSEGEARGAQPVAVLGYSYWQNRFGGDTGAIGKHILINGRPATIVGVAPPDFHGMFSIFETDVYLPYSALALEKPANLVWSRRDVRPLLVFSRLKPGVSFSQAQASVDVIVERLAEQFPATDSFMTVRVLPEKACRPIPYANGFFTMAAALFLVLAALVLLLAALNVENLMLVRGTARQREMGIRTALGAGRNRLIRQMLTESLVLAGLAAAVGLALGFWASRLMGSIHATGMPIHLDSTFDWRVFAYTLALGLASGILVGLLPAVHACSRDSNSLLHQGGHGSTPGLPRVRNFLVVAQVAGSLALLVVAGLFVDSLRNARRLDLGFEPDHLLNVTLDPSRINYDKLHAKEFYRALEVRVASMPGVSSVSLASNVPMGPFPGSAEVSIEEHPVAPGHALPRIGMNRVDFTYFATMEIPLQRGRDFTEADNENSPPVAIINQTMAGQFWPHEDPLGRRFSVKGSAGPFLEVVGVARDGKYKFVSEDPSPYFYIPLAQDFTFRQILQIRTTVPPQTLAATVTGEVSKLAPSLNIIDLRTMQESLEGALGFYVFRLAAIFASIISGVGLLLAVIGVYGVVSFAAAQRTREIGIRMALGAEEIDILSMVWKQGVRLVAIGAVAGTVPAALLGKALWHFVVGVSAADPVVYFAPLLVIFAVGLTACWIPARRAMKVDPMVALRYE